MSKRNSTGDPLARLSEADRAELRLEGLSLEVGIACRHFFASRGFGIPPARARCKVRLPDTLTEVPRPAMKQREAGSLILAGSF
jgi:hypothetical protein